MADVTGPIPTLPGTRYKLPEGMTCDDHPDRPAVKRVQGETDSFGCELLDLCQECLDEMYSHTHSGICDWCKKGSENLQPKRDFDEGLAGPVYHVCNACATRG